MATVCGRNVRETEKEGRNMKHLKDISKKVPAPAMIWGEDHPGIKESVMGLVKDPVGTILLHIGWGSDE